MSILLSVAGAAVVLLLLVALCAAWSVLNYGVRLGDTAEPE